MRMKQQTSTSFGKKTSWLKRIGHGVTWILVSVSLILVLLTGAITVVFYGPSSAARDLLVLTSLETSAMKFLPRLYFSPAQIEAIIEANSPRDTTQITDGSEITIPDDTIDLSRIDVVDVNGPTFVGKMMIVYDPARCGIFTIPRFSPDIGGMRLKDMVSSSDSVAGINGGAFEDINGVGRGGMPMGIVIRNGEILVDSSSGYRTVIGFDAQHRLIIGNMSAQAALDRGVVDAISFGPALIINGESVPILGSGGGLNPRTAIGQRADGAILLLVIDGRQPHSIGATLRDVADVMADFGAVNAANLDGGSSTLMVYNGEILNSTSLLTGPRRIPTAIVVSKAK